MDGRQRLIANELGPIQNTEREDFLGEHYRRFRWFSEGRAANSRCVGPQWPSSPTVAHANQSSQQVPFQDVREALYRGEWDGRNGPIPGAIAGLSSSHPTCKVQHESCRWGVWADTTWSISSWPLAWKQPRWSSGLREQEPIPPARQEGRMRTLRQMRKATARKRKSRFLPTPPYYQRSITESWVLSVMYFMGHDFSGPTEAYAVCNVPICLCPAQKNEVQRRVRNATPPGHSLIHMKDAEWARYARWPQEE